MIVFSHVRSRPHADALFFDPPNRSPDRSRIHSGVATLFAHEADDLPHPGDTVGLCPSCGVLPYVAAGSGRVQRFRCPFTTERTECAVKVTSRAAPGTGAHGPRNLYLKGRKRRCANFGGAGRVRCPIPAGWRNRRPSTSTGERASPVATGGPWTVDPRGRTDAGDPPRRCRMSNGDG